MVLAALVFVAGCAATTPATIGPAVDRASTTQLWIEHGKSTITPLQLAYVEAELVSRGETKFGSAYIGRRTGSAYGKTLYARGGSAPTSPDLKNCSDFSSSWQAQRYFLDAGGPVNDPHNLDGDGDGLACEWGTRIRSIARKARAPVVRRPVYTRTCYTGPRGGRYTITASGRKNYGGC